MTRKAQSTPIKRGAQQPARGPGRPRKGTDGPPASGKQHGMQRESYTIDEFAAKIGVARNTAYQAARAGEIPAIRIRGRFIVPHILADQYMRGEWQPRERR